MKRRLSASIDEDVLAAAERAVRDGHAPSVSALVEDAIRRQVEHGRRVAEIEGFAHAFETQFGAFAPGEIDELAGRMRARIGAEHSGPKHAA